jgi:hypothetical protein
MTGQEVQVNLVLGPEPHLLFEFEKRAHIYIQSKKHCSHGNCMKKADCCQVIFIYRHDLKTNPILLKITDLLFHFRLKKFILRSRVLH